MSVLVPPDAECNAAYQQIAAIARAHALVVSASGGVMTIAIPERQREEEGIREMVLRMHCMVEISDDGREYDAGPTPTAQWPKKRPIPSYKPKMQQPSRGVDLNAFEE